MSEFKPTGRLQEWDGTRPDLRQWSDLEVLDGLRQLGIDTDRERFTARAATALAQGDVEEEWLQKLPTQDENLQVFTWMTVQELWERWQVATWPRDRLARMFAYLVDAEFGAEWANRCHAPTADEVFNALEEFLNDQPNPQREMEALVEQLGMPPAALPGKLIEAMAEWSEVGAVTRAERGGALLTKLLGRGHSKAYLAAALISARMLDRAQAAALEVPLEAPVDGGFDETVGYLCLAAGDAMLADYWIRKADLASGLRKSELTLAAETVRNFLDDRKQQADDAAPVPEQVRKAAKVGASQAAYYAIMAFAGGGTPGGV
jgi:hypothetical protein